MCMPELFKGIANNNQDIVKVHPGHFSAMSNNSLTETSNLERQSIKKS